MTHRKVVIIGSGPAGHASAIYTSRAQLNPLMLEGDMAGGVAAGGQLTTTTEVENYPGFESISGPELMQKMRDQSVSCGAEILTKTVTSVDLSQRPFKVVWTDGECTAETVIISTGATAKRLGIPGEELFWQKGMSACAVCDGALPLFRQKPLVVIGGGDTAAEEALFLTKYASEVHLLVRRDEMRASKVMQQRVLDHEKITIHWNTEAVEAKGDQLLSEVVVVNNKTQETASLAVSGLFYAIGHEPNTGFLDGQITLDDTGYIVTQPGTTLTNIDGVFACGDVQDKIYRQAISAAGSGCMAALDAERFLVENPVSVTS